MIILYNDTLHDWFRLACYHLHFCVLASKWEWQEMAFIGCKHRNRWCLLCQWIQSMNTIIIPVLFRSVFPKFMTMKAFVGESRQTVFFPSHNAPWNVLWMSKNSRKRWYNYCFSFL